MNPSPRKAQVSLENAHLENLNPSQSDQFDARSTGEQEAPEEQRREFQVLREVGNGTSTGRRELDTRRARIVGWIPSAGGFFGKHSQVGLTWMDGAHLG
ncbi:hypothetical protein DUI87_35480 [Hirundo rustica rustica]|uniref:Uncharacterized protein n=1 Tax=Hirundo rustica rustica TaxID=333673 RepID=A0A3M0IHB2_HIRRU|nr:hypothetical protein DUI87_35480 [Hirundo rustica rustica]